MQREYKIALSQEYYSETVYLSQYDSDYNIVFNVVNKYAAADVDGMTAKFTGTRCDGMGFEYTATGDGSTLSFTINLQLSRVAGTHTGEIVIYDAGGLYFGSANVQIIVEKAAHPNGTIDAGTEEELTLAEQVQQIVDTAAETVTQSIADAYSTSSTYAVGDYCIYNNTLYRCTTAISTAEAWTSGHWTAVDVTDEVSSLKSDLTEDLIDLGTNGDIVVPVTFNWQNGYISDSGVLSNSTASQYALVTLTAGQTIIAGTRNTNATVIASTTSDSVSIGDTLTVIYKTGGTDVYTEFSYTAKENINLVISVKKSEFYVHIKEPSLIKTVSERVDYLEEGVAPIEKTLTWSNGWIGTNGKINSSTASQFALVQLNRGETVKVGTANSSTCIIGRTTESSVSVGNTISTISTTGAGDTGYIEHTYTAQDTINIVICVNKKNYDVKFYEQSNLGICEEKITDLLNIADKNYYEETVSENGGFGASGLTYGTSNRIRTALIPFSARTRIVIKNGSLQHACGMWKGAVDSSHIKRNDNSFNTKDETIVTAYNGYLVVIFRNSSNTSLSPSDYDGTIEVYPPSFCNLEETLKNLNSARHIPRNAGVPLTILHISDIHNSPITLDQIVEQAKYYGNNVDDMICTGDLVADTYTSITSWWNEKVLTCIGNHDTAGYVDGNFSWTALSMANRDAYYIAPFESNWNITHASGTSYYYKDYADANVRMIVMDAMLYNNNGSEATAQTTWLTNLLADAITNDLHVLIAIHAPHGGAKAVNCSFTELGITDMSTLSDCNTPQSVIDAVATAINNGLHFIGYICGHTHRDTIWDAENDGSQLMFSIICAMNSPANTDLYRGANNNAYNLVTIDTVNTLVKIVRGGGADIDNAMRPREAICFNYSTGEKVGEVL